MPPTINCVSNKTVQCNQAWQFDMPTAYDNCGTNSTVSLIASNPFEFNPPCSTVYRGIWRAVDSCGNSTTCTQLVIVADTISPSLCCPNDMTFTTCSNSVVVNFKVEVTDNC